MVRSRSPSELINNRIQFYRVAQPNLNTGPGTTNRDVLIDGQATEDAKLYDEIARASQKQSPKFQIGSDIDNYLANYKEYRLKGAKAQVIALMTFDSLDSDLAIIKGSIITAKNGLNFVVVNSLTLSPVLLTSYQATASKYKADLDFLGITDQYAVEILAEATVAGTQGNISKYALISTNVTGINSVTNTSPVGNGKDAESDTQLKTRFSSLLSGANTGTSLGYKSAVISDSSVIDAVVIEPGDSLMIRDGTQVFIAEDGTRTIISEGTGGKTDIIVLGSRLQESSDSFIYKDISNTGDPTNSKNDFVLGQISGDSNKTVQRKRIDNLTKRTVPSQPINNVISVSGSLSGSAFKEKTTDSLGRISGNYELIGDTGAFAGSPWGFDKIHWISNKIQDYPEDKTKTIFNGQESVSFTDVVEFKSIQQNIVISNENSKVIASNRSLIQLFHYPCSSVTRVFNATTGERYTVENQNPNGGSTNETGIIQISGKSLPSTSDILQVDYTWIFNYDKYFDFDDKINSTNLKDIQDNLDWGYSNLIRREQSILTTSGSFLKATVSYPISSVISVNSFISETEMVTLSSGRYVCVVGTVVKNILSIVRVSDSVELFNTAKANGSFSGFTIFFPTDSLVELNDTVQIIYNTVDVYNGANSFSFNGNDILFSPTLASSGNIVECNYIANINNILPSTLVSNLPAIRSNNQFNVKSSLTGYQPTLHIYNGSQISQNLRYAPSVLQLILSGGASSGTVSISGTTSIKITDIVYTISSNGLKQDLSLAIRKYFNLLSKESVPSIYKIFKIAKLEKVSVVGEEVISSDYEFELKNYSINDASFVKYEAISNASLKSTEFLLASTPNNITNTFKIGDKARITFYLLANSQTENIYFYKQNTAYTQKKFLLVDSISISSGFNDVQSLNSTLTINNLNQPTSKSRYRVFYDYTAPKTNERITVKYNYDRLIGDLTLRLEGDPNANIKSARPINGDVLIKSSNALLVDVVMNVVVLSEFETNSEIVKQNVKDVITTALQASKLGTTIDANDLVNAAYTISGVDRARVLYFNKKDIGGFVLSVTAQKNEYIFPNNITVNTEKR